MKITLTLFQFLSVLAVSTVLAAQVAYENEASYFGFKKDKIVTQTPFEADSTHETYFEHKRSESTPATVTVTPKPTSTSGEKAPVNCENCKNCCINWKRLVHNNLNSHMARDNIQEPAQDDENEVSSRLCRGPDCE